ncbi:hypothetical protein SXCC_03390 [Gluconacetobacter sp. SXCC-1]|nr:hypothetical protein SXCC_03390 [Gluconacetobacter sp. SXCC-1]
MDGSVILFCPASSCILKKAGIPRFPGFHMQDHDQSSYLR